VAATSHEQPGVAATSGPEGLVEHGGDWQSELRARGYRLTPQRRMVLAAVEALQHATPDEIVSHLRERASGINISTVYRTLDLLESLGLVTHTHLAHGAPTYHAAGAPEHAHVVCRGCEGVTEVSAATVADLVEALSAELGFETEVSHLTVFGTCADCRDRAEVTKR
jgi:Fur family ferric uptake transcriptional regulator